MAKKKPTVGDKRREKIRKSQVKAGVRKARKGDKGRSSKGGSGGGLLS